MEPCRESIVKLDLVPLMGKEGHCSVNLRTTDASFTESLYGLRRRAVNIKVKNVENASLDSF